MSKHKGNRPRRSQLGDEHSSPQEPGAAQAAREPRTRRFGRAWGFFVLLVIISCGYWLGMRLARPRFAAVDLPAGIEIEALLRDRIETLRAAVSTDPDDAEAHGELGLCYEASELWSAAAKSYAQAAVLAPQSSQWRQRMAVARSAEGDLAGARALLDTVIRDEPAAAGAHHRRGMIALDLDDLDGAAADFKRATELAPAAAEGWLGIGQVELRRRRIADAIAALEQAIACDRKYAAAHHALGMAYRAAGREHEAIRELSIGEGGRVRPLGDPLAERLSEHVIGVAGQVKIANQLIAVGRAREAADAMRRALSARPDEVVLLATLGIAQVHSGDLPSAEISLKRALQLDPENSPACINLAALLLRTGNLAQADPISRHAIAIAPTSGAAHRQRGLVLVAQGHADEGIKALEYAILVDPTDPRGHLDLARAQFSASKHEDMRANLEAAVKLAPFDPVVQLARADLLYAVGDSAGAGRAIEIVEEVDPQYPGLSRLKFALQGGGN